MREIAQRPSHFVDGHLTAGPKFKAVIAKLKKNERRPTGEEYGGIILPGSVLACVDIALGYDGRLLFGLRVNEPAKKLLAFTGGRMRRGESFQDTASRHAKRDFGVTIEPRRIKVVRGDSYAWSRRAQLPQDLGCHMQGTTCYAAITAEEAEQVRRLGDSSEILWLTLEEIRGKPGIILEPHRLAAEQIFAGQFQP